MLNDVLDLYVPSFVRMTSWTRALTQTRAFLFISFFFMFSVWGKRSNRMDSGRFESVLKPYKFHQVMRSLFVPLRLATDARRLEFITDLDTTIDDVRPIFFPLSSWGRVA